MRGVSHCAISADTEQFDFKVRFIRGRFVGCSSLLQPPHPGQRKPFAMSATKELQTALADAVVTGPQPLISLLLQRHVCHFYKHFWLVFHLQQWILDFSNRQSSYEYRLIGINEEFLVTLQNVRFCVPTNALYVL